MVVAELVENLTFFLVGKDIVGLLDLLEFFLGGLIVRVNVRVELAREFPVGLFNLVSFRVLLDP